MSVKLKNITKIAFTLCCVLLLSSSCTKENDYYYENTEIYTADFDVKKGDWLWDSARSAFYYRFNHDIIIPSVIDNGSVVATILIDGSFRQMPYTYYFIENGIEFAETISFEFNDGYIRFNITALDGFKNAAPNYQPKTAKFRVTAISYL